MIYQTVLHQMHTYLQRTWKYSELEQKKDKEELQQDLYKLDDWRKKWLLKFHSKNASIWQMGKMMYSLTTHYRVNSYRKCKKKRYWSDHRWPVILLKSYDRESGQDNQDIWSAEKVIPVPQSENVYVSLQNIGKDSFGLCKFSVGTV